MGKWQWSHEAWPHCTLPELIFACTGVAASVAQTASWMVLDGMAGHGASATSIDTVKPASPAFETALLGVHLNLQDLHQAAIFLQRPDAKVLARVEDLALWRLRSTGAALVIYQNESYILLDDLGLSYRVDHALSELWISAKVSNLLPSIIDARDAVVLPARTPTFGGFLNYDFSAQHSQSFTALPTQLELGVFANGWVGTSTFLNPDASSSGHFIRLESTWNLDRPDRMASLRFGDVTGQAGAWGRSVRFGGVQWVSNFATQAGFISFPLPSVSGSATLPSTAEVFVNQILSSQREIAAGPFTVRELPVFTGQGEIQMVVHDLLGHEQTIVQPFYAAPTLLRKGLDSFSYEFGALRNNFSIASNDYGPLQASAILRHGVTDQLTLETRSELRAGRQTVGLAATALWRQAGVFNTALAASHSAAGAGALLSAGFDRQSSVFSFGMKTQVASLNFDQIGLADGTAPLRQNTAQVGWNALRLGSFGLGYVRIDHRGQSGNQVLSASYSRNLGQDWFLGLSAFKSLLGNQDFAVSLVLTHAFGKTITANLNASRSSAFDGATLQVQQNLPAGAGVGYRILAGLEPGADLDASLNLQNGIGTYTIEAARQNHIDAYRAFASGGMALLGGQTFLARRIEDSFAVVRVPGFANVRVYAENQPVARTDSAGSALIPGLRPYQNNRLAIGQEDLPFDAHIDALEIDVVPYFRSGYIVEFPVVKSNGALLRIVTIDGKPIPTGAQVSISGHQEVFPVAQDGQTYLTGLAAHNHVDVSWNGKQCSFELAYHESSDPLPDLGSVICGKP